MTYSLMSRTPAKALGLAVVSILVALCFATDAHASFGQLASFGRAGTGEGEISTLACGPQKETEGTPCATAIGVDAKEGNAVFVIDQWKLPLCDKMEGETCNTEEAHERTRYFRIQKFENKNGEGYKVVAKAEYAQTVKYESSFLENGGEEADSETVRPAVEGLAVDAEKGKVFALLTDPREGGLVDENDTAAGQLLAFNTSNLTPAGPGGTTPVIDEEKQLSTLATGTKAGNERAKALLDPQGITVDPVKHEVIVLAHSYSAGAKTDPLSYTAKAGSEPADHYVLQRINEETGALEGRYEEKTGVLGERTGEELKEASSPVVVPQKTGEPKIFVAFEGLVEIPYNFSGSAKAVYRQNNHYHQVSEGGPEVPSEESGGGMLTAAGGKLFETAYLLDGEFGVSGVTGNRGVYERSGEGASAGSAIGFTGGQQSQFEPNYKCVIGPENREEATPVAAGGEEKIFVLATEYLNEAQTKGSVTGQGAIIELGQGGQGCATASAKPIEASANGTIQEGEEVPPGATVDFHFKLEHADQIAVKWTVKQTLATECKGKKAGEVVTSTTTTQPNPVLWTEPVLNAFEYEQPELALKVECRGPLTVEADAQTDNLNTPEVNSANGQPLKFQIKVGYSVKAKFNFTPSEGIRATETAVKFTNTSTVNKNDTVEKLIWKFGDGTEKTLTPAEEKANPVEHIYAKPCGECKVTLTVVDREKIETTSEPQTVKVIESKAEQAARELKEKEAREAQERQLEAERHAQENKEREEHNLLLSAQPSTKASRSGAAPLRFGCSGTSRCSVTFSVVSSGPVAVPHHHGRIVLKLGMGSITLSPGSSGTVTLRLSSQARAVLKKYGKIKAKVSFVAIDQLGEAHRGSFLITIRR